MRLFHTTTASEAARIRSEGFREWKLATGRDRVGVHVAAKPPLWKADTLVVLVIEIPDEQLDPAWKVGDRAGEHADEWLLPAEVATSHLTP